MRAFIINGARDAAEPAAALGRKTRDILLTRGWDVDLFDVGEKKVAFCRACGSCGTKTPGICALKDDGRTVAERTAECDLMAFVSDVTFGGFSPAAKRAVERTMPNIHPLFLKHRGEFHHRMRYEKHPALLVVGWQPAPDDDAAAIFLKVGERNAVNYLSPGYGGAVISGPPGQPDTDARLVAAIDRALASPWETTPPLAVPGPDPAVVASPSAGPLLLVSASNRRHSNSRAIMDGLATRIEKAGGRCATLDVPADGFLRGDNEDLLGAFRSSARAVFISPLYHDQLTCTAMSVLVSLAARRSVFTSPLDFAAIVHSGYPEPVHTRTALAVCRKFASDMAWRWAGGLTAGATSPVGGRPLEQAGGIVRNLRKALDIAAEALAAGRPIPDEAVRIAAMPSLPSFLFVRAGNYLIRKNLKKAGVKDFSARPYAAKG